MRGLRNMSLQYYKFNLKDSVLYPAQLPHLYIDISIKKLLATELQ